MMLTLKYTIITRMMLLRKYIYVAYEHGCNLLVLNGSSGAPAMVDEPESHGKKG
jgi:hypothetical protein